MLLRSSYFRVVIVCFLMVCGLGSSAQGLYIDTLVTPHKNFGRASAELLGVELLPWGYNFFVRKAEFAHVNFKSIGHNLSLRNWEWDDNSFATNQFAHPYHGQLYFNTFRTNGYDFWRSSAATVTGSFLWEVAGETHAAAPNDLINTSLGGIALGEMTYRISHRIINERQRGAKRQLSEVAGLLIDPLNGLNRILDGKWGRVSTIPGQKELNTTPLIITFDVGSRRYSEDTDEGSRKGKNERFGRIGIEYGDSTSAPRVPFSRFSASAEFGASDSAKLNKVTVSGDLYSNRLLDRPSQQQTLSVTMNYEYYKNTAFYYGAQSFNLNLLSAYRVSNRSLFRTQATTGLIALGAVQDVYLYYGEGRNYDYGPGINLLVKGDYNYAGRLNYSIEYHGGWFKTLNGMANANYLNTITTALKYTFLKYFSAELEWGHYYLQGTYHQYADVTRYYPYLRFNYGYRYAF